MVYRRFCHDRLHHLRSYFRFCSGHGASQQFFLSTNGIGIHRRANYHSVCARPAFLPHELGIHLRIFGEQVRLLVL